MESVNEKTRNGPAASGGERCGLPRALLSGLGYFAFYFVSFVYFELLLYTVVNGNVSGFSAFTVLFAMPPALLFAALCGFFRHRKVNRIVAALLILPATVYYLVNLVYYGIFGSLLSLQFVGMGGQAITNFGKGIWGVVFDSMHWVLLFLIPLAAGLVWAFAGRHTGRKTRHASRLILAAAVPLVWLAVVAALPAGGTDERSAYKAFHSTDIDFDTAAQKIGLMSNNIIELRNITASLFRGEEGDIPSRETLGDQTVIKNIDEIFGTSAPLTAPRPVTTKAPETGSTTGTDSSSCGEVSSGADTGSGVESSADTEEQTTEPYVDPGPDRSPHVLGGMDFAAMSGLSTNADIIDLCNYLSNVAPTGRNEFTGLFRDYNLVYVCAESFCSFAVNEKATPTLYRMSRGGIVLKNYYTCFKNTTTNGEFALLAGIWPDVSRSAKKGTDVGSMPQSASKYMPTVLGNVFGGAGVNALAYHNYLGTYYSRNKSLPNFGFSCKFRNDGLKVTNWYWPSSDNQMTAQALNDLVAQDRFAAYFMTFSGHGPYDSTNAICEKNIATTRAMLGETKLADQCVYYLAGEYELDLAMKTLIDGLEKAGKLDSTVFVIAGDHAPYYLSDASIRSFLGRSFDNNFEYYRSTCIIWNSRFEDEPIVVETPCCQVDILPTIYNLFDMDYDSRLYAGQDIFADTTHMAVLYNKNFITDKVKYINSSGKATWLIDTKGIPAETLNAYIDACKTIVAQRYNASLKMMDTDFYRFAYEKAAVLGQKES